jgi:hypothetical protein
MFLIDRAQLYKSKQSDCWIYIWVIFDHAPDNQYKKKYVLPGGIIPGPKKPKNLDSFIFPGLHHLCTIQTKGLPIWDGAKQTLFRSNPFLFVATADGPSMVFLTGLIGHHGRFACCLYCGLLGRHKPGAPPTILPYVNLKVPIILITLTSSLISFPFPDHLIMNRISSV